MPFFIPDRPPIVQTGYFRWDGPPAPLFILDRPLVVLTERLSSDGPPGFCCFFLGPLVLVLCFAGPGLQHGGLNTELFLIWAASFILGLPQLPTMWPVVLGLEVAQAPLCPRP